MTMRNEQIIREVVGRMADEAPAPLAFDQLGEPVVARADKRSSGLSTRRLVALAATLAVVAVFAVTAVFLTRPALEDATPVGAPADASVGEFKDALTDALAVLGEAPGIQGIQESYIQTHLAGRVWFSSRDNGDIIVVEQADIDVRDTAWWLTSAGPTAVGENLTTTARLVVEGDYYQATVSDRDSQPWSQPEIDPPGTLAFGLVFFDDQFGPQVRDQIAPPDANITRQDTANGGEIWTVKGPADETSGEQRFYVHPDGYLASWSWQALRVNGDPNDQTAPIDAGNISYLPLDNPDELAKPEVGTPLDLTAYDLPEGFPIGD